MCVACRAEQVEGSVFCEECGASLLEKGAAVSTRPLTRSVGDALREDDSVVPGAGAAREAAAARPQTVPAALALAVGTIAITVAASGRMVALGWASGVLIGREDSARSVGPDIDLGPDGGYDAGVSRRHARIAAGAAGLVLEDLGSANGTLLNGRPLARGESVALERAAEVTCGSMVLQIVWA